MLRIAFQNTRGLNFNKLNALKAELTRSHMVFCSEHNRPFAFPETGIKFHHPQIAESNKTWYSRLALLARPGLEIKPLGFGLRLEQNRSQQDQIVGQSYVYRVKSKNESVVVENTYLCPDINSANLSQAFRHFEQQAQTYKNYVCGGDFNFNYKNPLKRRRLREEMPSLENHIRTSTRIARVLRNGISKVSQTTIDLIFTNSHLTTKKHQSQVVTCRQDLFDHKMTTIQFDFPSHKAYRLVKRPINFTQRPNPSPCQIGAMNQEVFDLKLEDTCNYDNLMGKVKNIVDKYIPLPAPGYKVEKIYNIPYSKELRAEIARKHELEKSIVTSGVNWDNYKIQRNLVSRLCRRETQNFYHSKFKVLETTDSVQKVINNINSSQKSNLLEPKEFQIGSLKGQKLAEELAKFYKFRAEEICSDEKMYKVPLPEVLRPGEKELIKNKFKFDIKVPHDFSKIMRPSKRTNATGPDTISPKVLGLIWPALAPKMQKTIMSKPIRYPQVWPQLRQLQLRLHPIRACFG